MQHLLVGATLCLLTIGATVTVGPVAAQDDYSLTVGGAVKVPSQTVEFGDDTFEVSTVGITDPGGTVQVHSSGPSDGYNLVLLNGDKQVVDDASVSGDDSANLNVDPSAGTYFVTLNIDGERERLQPVVAEGYDVSLSIPANATNGEPVNATVDVERREGTEKDVESVEVVLWGDDNNQTVTVDGDGEGLYNVMVTVDEPGDFVVHATVRGEQTIDGGNELLAISERHEVSVEATEDDSDDGDFANDDDGDSGGSAGEANGNDTAVATETASDNATAPPAETTSQPEDTENDDGVVTPADTTEPKDSTNAETTTSRDGPVSLSGMLSALAMALAALRLRRQ